MDSKSKSHSSSHSRPRLSPKLPLDRPTSLSRSASVNSAYGPLRPKSRGSTASLQSVGIGNGFQPQSSQQQQPEPNIPLNQGFYVSNANIPHTQAFQHPDDTNAQYPQHMSDMHHSQISGLSNPMHPHAHQDMRPMSQHGFHDMSQYPMQYQSAMPQYNMQPQHISHMRHASEHYEGSPAPEDSQGEAGGAKRRKGTPSSMANDQELRRLLQQYNGRSLKEVALEVQKTEGASGKSEKAKQVFAMLWLQENCQRTTDSVRRDRVFARYTERCGNERVPTLNPASFGKLVRIIFPNVQTRRLGVRGESKYHYVDLSLVPDENDTDFDAFERPGTSGAIMPPERPASSASLHKPLQINTRPPPLQLSAARISLETADFPPPPSAALFPPRPIPQPSKEEPTPIEEKMDCAFINTAIIRVKTTSPSLMRELPSVRANVPASLSVYMAMPRFTTLCPVTPSFQESPIELPDIHEYLVDVNYDRSIAKLLHDLYRSYCIDVIDAFRKCKDKSFFNHHAAFNGKMTVPVSKLFTLPSVAAWIHECDMRMYKQILRYFTSLVLQNVPGGVWEVFDRISKKLVPHLINAFEEKCPPHVVAAKVIPAARFTSLLDKLAVAQAATVQISRWFDSGDTRTQMWLDTCSLMDPEQTIDESSPPPEAIPLIRGMLKHDLRWLFSPSAVNLVDAAEQDPNSAFAEFYREDPVLSGVVDQTGDKPRDILSRLVQWLQSIPKAFEGHHPQCMMDWVARFFRSIENQMANQVAQSVQGWWSLGNFASQMIAFMAQLEGLWLPAKEHRNIDAREQKKKDQQLLFDTQTKARQTTQGPDASSQAGQKRKRMGADIGGEERAKSPASARPRTAGDDTEPESTTSVAFPMLPPNHPHQEEIEDDDMAEINKGGPLDLPTFKTGLTSPIKPPHEHHNDHTTNPSLHDDSGIDLGFGGDLDPDALEAEKEAKKFRKSDWFHLSSDPPEPTSHSTQLVS